MPAPPAHRGHFMRLPDVMHETGLSRSTIYREIKRGQFPKQSKLAANSSGWWSAQIDAWRAARLKENSEK